MNSLIDFLLVACWRGSARALAGLAVAAIVSGCAVGPDYRPPEPEAPTVWQSPLPHGGSLVRMEDWWNSFDDPLVTELIAAAEEDSPTLAKAWANIEKARANLRSTQSNAYPGLTGSASASRSNQSQSSTSVGAAETSRSAGLDASWELDLFGKVRRNTEAARARMGERTNDWHQARISLAAEVADTYVQYRGCLMLVNAYERQLISAQATEKATTASVSGGFSAPADASLARAAAASTFSTLTEQRGTCDILVKSLVYLTGMEEPRLRQQLSKAGTKIPQPAALAVNNIPANVLRQRPDVASLERELAATSAEIGAAKADLYPSLSLSGSITFTAASVPMISSPSWSFGPSLSLPIFDGGKRRAAVTSAEATYQGALAGYRDGVRTAVKEVEQALVYLDTAAKRAESAESAARHYDSYFKATQQSWRAGMTNLLSLEEARRSALSAEVTLIGLQRDRVQYWVSLYKKLGGGWQAGDSARSPDALAKTETSSPKDKK